MTGPLASLTALIGCSLITGLVIETSWIIGVPLLVGLCCVVYWSSSCLHEWQKKEKDVSAAALIILTLIMSLSGMASVASSIYYPMAKNTLYIMLVAAIPAHCVLIYAQQAKINNHLHLMVVLSIPLTPLGLIITGLRFNISWLSTIPGTVLLAYSLTILCYGLYYTKMIDANVAVNIALAVLLASTISAFVSYFLAPLWCPVALLATACAAPFVITLDFYATGTFAKNGGYSAVLQLVSAAAAGVAVAAKMPVAWLIISAVGLLPITVVMAIHLCRIHWREKFENTQPSTLAKLPVVSLLIILTCVVVLLMAFHVIFSSLPALIPLIFLAIAVLCILAVHIICRCTVRARWFLAASGLMCTLAVHCCLVFVALTDKSTHIYNDVWRVHLVAMVISIVLSMHCVAIPCSWEEYEENRQLPLLASSPVAKETNPLVSLAVLFVCSILAATTSCISWMAAMPIFFVYCAAVLWTCWIMQTTESESIRFVVPLSYVLLVANTALAFVSMFHATYLVTVFIFSAIAYAMVLFVAERQVIGIRKGCLRVTSVLLIIAAFSEGVIVVAAPNDKAYPICVAYGMIVVLASAIFISTMMACIHYDGYKNARAAPIVERPRLQLAALIITTSVMATLHVVFHRFYETMPVLVPVIFVGIAVLYLLALHIIFNHREKIKYHGVSGFLLLLLFCYLIFVFANMEATKQNALKPILILTLTPLAALISHCLIMAFVINEMNNEKKINVHPPPAAAQNAAAAAPVVVAIRDVDSDYESVASDDDDDGDDDGGQNV